MGDLSERIKAELENIDEVIEEIPAYSRLPHLSSLELAGVATLLHNFYNGVENILKKVLFSHRISIPEGGSWHRDLLERAAMDKIISDGCKDHLLKYLAFRHFFSHAYALDLQPDKMEPLVENSRRVYALFRKEKESLL